MPTPRDRQGPRALAYSVPPGLNSGMGHHAAQALAACAAARSPLLLLGPRPSDGAAGIELRTPPALVADWRRRYTWLRYLHGRYQFLSDRRFGRWLAGQVPPALSGCYVFTQIASEALVQLNRWSVPSLLDSPNGHIRHFREAVQQEASQWLNGRYPGHPTAAMVDRVEAEYGLASHIRVASRWAAETLTDRGIGRDRVSAVSHSVDLERFRPDETRTGESGMLRIVFVGGLTLGKGFAYLLTALRALRTRRIALEIVGGTGDPWCRRLFDALRSNVDVTLAPGDPAAAYRRADLLVLPTLHDGFGYVVAEAMASGVPVITTTCCGAAEWIEPERSGWIVPAGNQAALTAAIDAAASNRLTLRDMGRHGRRAAEAKTRAAVRELQALVEATLPLAG
jgi:glycosyltransferase involved in cell wall biosynthesis